jgi:hypothetical protein
MSRLMVSPLMLLIHTKHSMEKIAKLKEGPLRFLVTLKFLQETVEL